MWCVIVQVLTFCVEMGGHRIDHTDHFILERTAVPDKNILKAQGETVFEEEQPSVCLNVIGHLSDIVTIIVIFYPLYQ